MKIFNVTQNNLNFSNKFYGFYNPYLYMPKPAPDDKFSFKDHKLEYFGGGLTVLLALVTLTRFANKKTFVIQDNFHFIIYKFNISNKHKLTITIIS